MFLWQQTDGEVLLRAPMTIDVKIFLHALLAQENLQADLSITNTRFPLRLRGRAAQEWRIMVSGPDRKRFLQLLDERLDDYLEANGYFF